MPPPRAWLLAACLCLLLAPVRCALPGVSRLDADCADAPRAGEHGRVRLPMGGVPSPQWPWRRPFPRACLSWDARGAVLSQRERVARSACDSFTVDVEGRYVVLISTHEVHRDVRDVAGLAPLFARDPDAVVRIHEDGRFMQWKNYRGDSFYTSRKLRPGRVYRICVAGRRRSFTVCTVNLIACDGGEPADCGVPGKDEVASHFRHARRFSERKC